MAFEQGLSGLQAASKSLDVIGNNVANSGTVGFKQSTTLFSDVYARSLNGGGGSQVGIGVQVANVQQEFSQGNVTSSNNSLDVAINGNGFFKMSDSGAISYSRNGQFQMDKSGYITNAAGQRLQGYSANNGVVTTGATTDIQIDSSNLLPVTTSKVSASLNLDSRSAVNGSTFNASDPTTYTNTTTVPLYDAKGVSHSLQLFFTKTVAGNPSATPATLDNWTVHSSLDGAAAVSMTSLTFPANGSAPASGGTQSLSVAYPTGSSTVAFDFTSTTEFGSVYGVNSLTQNGSAAGQLSNFTVSADGTILGSYSNGQTNTLGQVALVNFANPNGLAPIGNNQWTETATSGVPIVGTPTSAGLGTLQSKAVEDSNVDLTSELVNMITAQRAYQANAQTIKTQDQVLQTLVNLR